MKTIVYRGGLAQFRIPAHWLEEYSDLDGGTFYEDDPSSGTLRLKVITMSTDKDLHSGSGRGLLNVVVDGLKRQGIKGLVKDRQDGNALFSYEEPALDRGISITIFYWVIANPLPPHHARIYTFSWTILSSQRDMESTRDDLRMLEGEIESANFPEEVGILAD